MVLSLSLVEKAAMIKMRRSFKRKAMCLSSKSDLRSTLLDSLSLRETYLVIKTLRM